MLLRGAAKEKRREGVIKTINSLILAEEEERGKGEKGGGRKR